jgi:hypothetical protein
MLGPVVDAHAVATCKSTNRLHLRNASALYWWGSSYSSSVLVSSFTSHNDPVGTGGLVFRTRRPAKKVSVWGLMLTPEMPKEEKSKLMFKELEGIHTGYLAGIVDSPNLDTKVKRVYKLNTDLWGCPVVIASDGRGASLVEEVPRLGICSTIEAFSATWGLTEHGTCYRPEEIVEILKEKYPLLARDIKEQEDRTIYRTK